MPTRCFQNVNRPSSRHQSAPASDETTNARGRNHVIRAPRKEVIQIIHLDSQGSPDYWAELTVKYDHEEGQWAGICEELGTATHADTLEQVEAELREAVELQLIEMENLTDIQGYLAENRVRVTPIQIQQQAGFAVAGSRFTT